MSLTFLFASELGANHLQALSNCQAIVSSVAGTATSGSYINTPGSPSITFIKIDNNSKVRVDFHASLTTTAQPTHVVFSVRINGADYDVAQLEMNSTIIHHQVSGTLLIASIPANTYTVPNRWKRTSGSGTLTMSTDDQISFALSEVQE